MTLHSNCRTPLSIVRLRLIVDSDVQNREVRSTWFANTVHKSLCVLPGLETCSKTYCTTPMLLTVFFPNIGSGQPPFAELLQTSSPPFDWIQLSHKEAQFSKVAPNCASGVHCWIGWV
jgi:hypothetical protein